MSRARWVEGFAARLRQHRGQSAGRRQREVRSVSCKGSGWESGKAVRSMSVPPGPAAWRRARSALRVAGKHLDPGVDPWVLDAGRAPGILPTAIHMSDRLQLVRRTAAGQTRVVLSTALDKSRTATTVVVRWRRHSMVESVAVCNDSVAPTDDLRGLTSRDGGHEWVANQMHVASVQSRSP